MSGTSNDIGQLQVTLQKTSEGGPTESVSQNGKVDANSFIQANESPRANTEPSLLSPGQGQVRSIGEISQDTSAFEPKLDQSDAQDLRDEPGRGSKRQKVDHPEPVRNNHVDRYDIRDVSDDIVETRAVGKKVESDKLATKQHKVDVAKPIQTQVEIKKLQREKLIKTTKTDSAGKLDPRRFSQSEQPIDGVESESDSAQEEWP